MAYYIMYGREYVHDPFGNADENGAMPIAYNASLSSRTNEVSTLTFSVAANHPMIEHIRIREFSNPVLLDWVPEYGPDLNLFCGFVSAIETGIDGSVTYTCKSMVALLARFFTHYGGQKLFSIAEWQLTEEANDKMKKLCQAAGSDAYFTLVNNVGSYSFKPEDYTKVAGALDRILDFPCRHGFTLTSTGTWDTRELTLSNAAATANSQTIRFGENMSTFRVSMDDSDIYNAIIPVGGKMTFSGGHESEQDFMIGTTNGPLDVETNPRDLGSGYRTLGSYIYNVESVRKYGVLAFTETFSEVTMNYDTENHTTQENKLIQLALAELKSRQHIPTTVIEVAAVDLSYSDSKSYTHLMPGQTVRCVHERLGIDEVLPVTAMDIDLDNPANTNYTLGGRIRSLTTRLAQNATALRMNGIAGQLY